MAQHAARLGEIMLPELKKLNPAVVKTTRGKGLMNAIEIKPTDGKIQGIKSLLHFGNTCTCNLLCVVPSTSSLTHSL